MTGRTVYLSLERLRRAAAVVRRTTGLRVEVQEPPRRPPPRCGKHAGNVQVLTEALRARLPTGRVVVEGVGVETPVEGGPGHVVPDLVVCPAGFLEVEDAFLHPQDVELAVEVVTPTAGEAHISEAVEGYAAAGVRALLVVDPRPGRDRWSLYTDPIAGHYWAIRRGGEGVVPLPEPFPPDGVPVRRLPRYARRRQQR